MKLQPKEKKSQNPQKTVQEQKRSPLDPMDCRGPSSNPHPLHGYWLKEVEYQDGLKASLEIEKEIPKTSNRIQTKRLSKILGLELFEGIPKTLHQMKERQLEELLDALCTNWLANDGIWFQAVERRFGLSDAKRCNDTCWTRFSPYEAFRIKTWLELPEAGGLEALKTALRFRLDAPINKQEIVEEKPNTFIFRMIECRVQAARHRKGLVYYPCKSGGMVEHRTFAETIDPRIQTECVGCPPDPPQPRRYCTWPFILT